MSSFSPLGKFSEMPSTSLAVQFLDAGPGCGSLTESLPLWDSDAGAGARQDKAALWRQLPVETVWLDWKEWLVRPVSKRRSV